MYKTRLDGLVLRQAEALDSFHHLSECYFFQFSSNFIDFIHAVRLATLKMFYES